MEIKDLLRYAMSAGCSDLYINAGKTPYVRHCRQVVPVDKTPITAEQIDAFREETLVNASERENYRTTGSADTSFAFSPAERFRLNFFRSFCGPSFVARPINSGGKLEFDKLGLPVELLQQVCEAKQGIILVVGSTGSGKSTTMAAIINYINTHFNRHIITIEDPIEYLHTDQASLVTQRELNGNAVSFADALRSALRESPDVIVIGETRDKETVETAISAALTGHLVITTVHTSDTVQAVERIIDLCPEEQRTQIAADLSLATVAILAQRLIPRADGEGMVPAIEILRGTPTVQKLIEERDFAGLDEALRRGGESGMITFTRAVFRLYKEGIISMEAAENAVSNRDEFRLLAKGMESGVSAFRSSYGSSEDAEDGKFIDMRRLLRTAIKIGASDLLLSTHSSPVLRLHGELRALDLPELGPGDTQRLLYSVLTPRQRTEFEENRELDFALSVTLPSLTNPAEKMVQRFRINGFFQRGNVAVAARVIANKIPEPSQLHLPPQILHFVTKSQGLILVTGPTGSGKSTTLASMIDHINRTRPCHIITIEDPIEYVHDNKMSLIEQREVHADTLSFSNALKYALRQDPDVILVGEMRDIETIASAITAAETGHLVLATLHTNSAPQTIDRIIDSFPAAQQNQIRLQLAGALLAVISQRLLPTLDGKGRIGAFEIMVGTPPVQALIREGKTGQLLSSLETGAKDGMMTLEKSLTELYEQKLVSWENVQTLTRDFQQQKES